jgi:hypothetical protein
MAIKADKWVVAAITAVESSKLANMADAADVALACDFFGFYLASIWIADHTEAYQQGWKEGFISATPITEDDVAHAVEHVAIVMTTQAFRVPTTQPVAVSTLLSSSRQPYTYAMTAN